MAKFRPARFAFEVFDLIIKSGKQIAELAPDGITKDEALTLITEAGREALDVMEAAGVEFAQPEPAPEPDPSVREEKVERIVARTAAINPRILDRLKRGKSRLGVVDTGDLEPVPAPSES